MGAIIARDLTRVRSKCGLLSSCSAVRANRSHSVLMFRGEAADAFLTGTAVLAEYALKKNANATHGLPA